MSSSVIIITLYIIITENFFKNSVLTDEKWTLDCVCCRFYLRNVKTFVTLHIYSSLTVLFRLSETLGCDFGHVCLKREITNLS